MIATKGDARKILISASKDGFLKFWDLQQQNCLNSFADEMMTKIQDFIMIPELRLLVIGSTDESFLKLYEISPSLEIKV